MTLFTVARRVPLRRSSVASRIARPVLGVAMFAAAHSGVAQNSFVQTNLVSNVPGLAQNFDATLKNPWGISFGATSPFWVSVAGSGVSNLYNGAGVKQGLVVTIPGFGAPSEPTGQVFNNTGSFMLSNGSNASFLFATTAGTIAAWNGAAGTTAMTVVNQPGSAYTGLAIGGTGATARLYAANFAAGKIDVFDNGFSLLSGSAFIDPSLPAGYSPFNAQNLGGSIFVTYALLDKSTGDETKGAGLGIVDQFDLAGNFVRRIASTGGALNAPWGLAIAPVGFGGFGGKLLVGNFGDGTINAYDIFTGALAGTLRDPSGNPIANDGLWGITFGNGGNGGVPTSLYFAAGLDDETNGLFGQLTATPEPGTLVLMGTGLLGLAGVVRRKRRQSV